MASQIQFRRGTYSNATSSSEVLALGEPFFVKASTNDTLNKAGQGYTIYVGDGSTQLKNLDPIYATPINHSHNYASFRLC